VKTRFLHTADWQLGMRRHFLGEEALPRFMQARLDAIDTLGRLARENECEFIVVAGDVFESNQVDRRTVRRALEALAAVALPVYLLPGNHDPLDAASLYRSPEFRERQPGNVFILEHDTPVEVRPGVEIVGVPWTSKEMRGDKVEEAFQRLEPAAGRLRICVAHGSVLPPATQIRREAIERALSERRIDFLALGDRHSTTEVAPRVWYAGAPEPTAYRETDAGHALVVELTEDACHVERHAIGHWHFVERAVDLDHLDDVEALGAWLAGLPSKESTILKLRFRGAIGLRARARLDETLEVSRDLFGAIEERDDGLAILPDDLTDLGLTGFAQATADRLAARAAEGDPTARDALALLFRLAEGA